MTKVSQFCLLIWKNWLISKRNLKFFLPEFIVPVIMCFLVMLLRRSQKPQSRSAEIYDSFCTVPSNLKTICDVEKDNDSNWGGILQRRNYRLLYSPKSEIVKDAMEIFTPYMNVVPFDSSIELENEFYSHLLGDFPFAAIQFEDILLESEHVPKNLKVEIRFPSELRIKPKETSFLESTATWATNKYIDQLQSGGPRDFRKTTGAAPFYHEEGFLAIQHLLTYSLIARHIVNASLANISEPMNYLPMIHMHRFPHAAYVFSKSLISMRIFMAIFVISMFYYQGVNLVRNMVYEKELNLKEMMQLMGVPKGIYSMSWFITCFISVIIAICIVTFMLHVNWPRPFHRFFFYSDPSVFMLFMISYGISMISFCFLISSLFYKANVAAEISYVIWFATLVPYLIKMYQYDELSVISKLWICLGANSCMAFGFIIIFSLEEAQEGIHWSNFLDTMGDDNISLGLVTAMLVLDTGLHMLIALYFEKLFPGPLRVRQKWYYPLRMVFKYFFINKRTARSTSFMKSKSRVLEEAPKNLKCGVEIINITKYYRRTCAVRNLSMKLYEDQITVLLGHNGAGKTTTIQILCGVIPPSSGNAFVNDYDVRKERDKIRQNLGICWQQNVLFDSLTVEEHLILFSGLKGLSSKARKAEAKRYMEILNLSDKSKAKPIELSGGMKRSLCVGLALCGGSSFLLLDEPTSGMDPSARQNLWSYIVSQKKGRTILLTTHQMNEADSVGDRIAILAGGSLQCVGSSFFLKQKYGAGYHIVIEKKPRCNSNNITRFLKHYIPNIQMESESNEEIKYLVDRSYISRFEKMLYELETRMSHLRIQSYGISLTTLEEVFLKVDSGHPRYIAQTSSDPSLDLSSILTESLSPSSSVKTSTNSDFCIKSDELHTGLRLVRNQIIAMVLKKSLVTYRALPSFITMLIIMILYLIFFNVISIRTISETKLPPLELSLNKYKRTVTLVQENDENILSSIYKRSVEAEKSRIEEVNNITTTLLELTKEKPVTVSRQYLIGAAISEKYVEAWFNNDPLHTPPLALGKVLDAVYKYNFGEEYTIQFITHPMPYKITTKIHKTRSLSGMGYQISFNVCFMLCMLSSSLIAFIIRERSIKFKHLQYVSGMNVIVFILVSYIFDVLFFITLSVPVLLVFTVFRQHGFSTINYFYRMVAIVSISAMPIVSSMNLIALMFTCVPIGVMWFFGFNFMSGSILFLIMQLLEAPKVTISPRTLNRIHSTFQIFPFYGLSMGLKDTYMLSFVEDHCREFVEQCIRATPSGTYERCLDYICKYDSNECCSNPPWALWKRPGFSKWIVTAICASSLCMKILILIEYKFFLRIIYQVREVFGSSEPVQMTEYDNDVLEEKQIIENLSAEDIQKDDYRIILRSATKYYKDFLAVNGISLGVKKFECFGLLGTNGAGKSTTFMMITGDINISYGDIYIQGYSLRKNPKKTHKFVGYCPQFDALLNELTAKETLIIFAIIRGVPLQKCNSFIDNLARQLEFQAHLKKKVRHLSGGNKRKLSTAVALTGTPKIILLDEPTTGMDPSSKRFLWNTLCEFRNSGKCLVLSSHSMEECEALCTRVAIMVNGVLKCIGTIQHLRHKFAEGYCLTIKLGKTTIVDNESENPSLFNYFLFRKKIQKFGITENNKVEYVQTYIQEHIPKAKLKEHRYDDMLIYYVDKSVACWELFGKMEKAKKVLPIEDYSIGQSNLEQVFLSFTRHQNIHQDTPSENLEFDLYS